MTLNLRLILLLVLLVGAFYTLKSHPFILYQNQPDVKTCNDSAQYYLENGQLKAAKSWISQALRSSDVEENEEAARTYLLAGEIEEENGFALQALTLYRKSKQLARQHDIKKIQASATNGIANSRIALSQYDSVLYFLQESITLDSSLNNRAICNLAFARYWQSQNQQDKVLEYYQKAYDAAGRLKNNKLMALALSGMATVYFTQEPDMKRVLEVLKTAIALCDSSKHNNIISRNYARMANAYMVLGKTKEAEHYLTRAKQITDISDNLPVKSYVLASLAILKAEQGDINTAAIYAEEPIRIKRLLGQKKQLQNDLLNISEWYMALKKYDKATETLTEGIALSKTLKDVVYLQYFYDRASQLDSLKGNYKGAYSNLKRSMIYKDSNQSVKRIKAVEEIREKYEAEQKEKTIAEKELVIQQQKYQQSIIVGASIIALLIAVVVIIAIRSRHRIRLQLEKQKQDYVRLQTIVHTQEEVQQSIARDIHDGLVQVLGAAKMSLQAIHVNGDKDLIFHRVKEASRIMDEACVEARNISHQLLPYSLMKDGLVPAIDELLKKSLRHYEFDVQDEPQRFDADIEINIYRIAQELVNNIIKHAQASHVSVQLSMNNEIITLAVKDNGKGFNASHQEQGVGLTNIITRAELMGGSVNVNSNPGAGTSVLLSVPL